MKEEEILRKAVNKASGNGYAGWKSFVPAFPPLKLTKRDLEKLAQKMFFLNKEKIIFSHDFAKAFWGEEQYGKCPYRQPIWHYHLQQMILEKEPIKYLQKFL